MRVDKIPPLSLNVSPNARDKMRKVSEILRQADYCEPRILRLLDVAELPTFRQRRRALPLYLWRTRGCTPLETLVRLFLLQQSVARDEARRAVKPTLLEDWVEIGLIRLAGNDARATVELYPYQDLLVASDWQATKPDEVMGVAASTRALARMTIRRRAGLALDLGTGCGILGFLTASHSEQVFATDLNPRAVFMAQFNAQLNGISNMVCLEGNLFEPVQNQKFDLIVCNPPFVVAPGPGYLHTHSGMRADRLCETIVRTAPAFLREGGYCQLLCNWVQVGGQDWRERLESWFEATGCDVWVLHSHTEEAADYALKRIRETMNEPDGIARRFDEWMAYYEQERIEAVGFGIINMRRSNRTRHWFRCDPLPKALGPCGAAIERGFALRDFLDARRDDRSLLEARLQRAPDLRWEKHYEMPGGGWSSVDSRLQLKSGLAYSGDADPDVAEFVSQCKGDRPLGRYLSELAAATGQDVSPLAPGLLRTVRRLIELGFLLPVDEK